MAESRKCPRCGGPLAADQALCPACVLRHALGDAGTPMTVTTEEATCMTTAEKVGTRIGRYKLLEKIGEGGCGMVYVAEQEEPVRRQVALKVIKLGMDTKQVVARFEVERQALALMDHPNIAKVFDAGATETGRPYFVMELVQGAKITDYCDGKGLSTRQRLELFIQVCRAIEHAHQKGVIHRDLKPSNILVTEHDEVAVPKVIDFGIAKATMAQQLTDKTVFTAVDQFLGTPAYMSPEQAGLGGLDIDTRSDVYSLGVLLYELITGRPPFDPADLKQRALDEVLRAIREQEPLRPSTRLMTLTKQELNRIARCRHAEPEKLPNLIRRDLDWVVMKALDKDRRLRYETATGLARELERYLRDEAVLARPPSWADRLRKLIRRNKLAFAATGAVVASLVIGFSLAVWQFLKERDAHRRAVTAEQAEVVLRQKAEAEAGRAKDAELKTRTTSSRSDFVEAVHLISEDRARDALAYLQRSLRANPENNAAATRLITLLTYRAWLTPTRVFKHNGPAQSIHFSPDSHLFLTISAENSIRVWDADTDKPLTGELKHIASVRLAQFSPSGARVLTISGDSTATVWDAQTGILLSQIKAGSQKVVLGRFSPDGNRFATVCQDRSICVWDVVTGQALTEPLRANVATEFLAEFLGDDSVQFSSSGEEILTISDDDPSGIVGYQDGTNGMESLQVLSRGTIGTAAHVWNVCPGRQLTVPLKEGAFVTSARFSPDGQRVVTTSFGKIEANIWELAKLAIDKRPPPPTGLSLGIGGGTRGVGTGGAPGQIQQGASGGVVPLVIESSAHLTTNENSIEVVSSTKAGGVVIYRGAHTVEKISKEAPQRPSNAPLSHTGQILSVRFSPDGRRIVTASEDKTARVWDGYYGYPVTEPLRHHDTVHLAEFSPDGARVVTATEHTVRLWDARSGDPVTEPIGLNEKVISAKCTSDGQVTTISGDNILRVWGERLPRVEHFREQNPIQSAQFSENGKEILTVSAGHFPCIWDVQNGRPFTNSIECNEQIFSTELSPDGRKLVTALGDKTARVWDVQSGKQAFAALRHGDIVQSARFSSDGKRIVTASRDKTARVWDAEHGQPVSGPLEHGSSVKSAQFCRDGSLIVTVCSDNSLRVWEVERGQPLTNPLPHDRPIREAEFSPDGTRVVAVSEGNTAYVWDARPGQPLTTLTHEKAVTSAHFSPDGKRVITASADNAVRLWDPKTGQLTRGPLWCRGTIGSVQFNQNGQQFVTASEGAGARVWDTESFQLLTDLFPDHEDVNFAQFSPDGKRILTAYLATSATGQSTTTDSPKGDVRLYDLAPIEGRCPPWLLELSEVISGQSFDDQGVLQPSKLQESETLKRIQTQLSQKPADDVWAIWGRWYLADPATRTVSPFSKIVVP